MATARPSQSQDGGENSTNYQAGNDVHVYGLTIEEARAMALDVFKSNALELAGIAQTLAVARAESLTNEFLAKLEADMPHRAKVLSDPDMQNVVFEAQKEYARSGEEDLKTALVDLLAARASEDDRGLRTLALNEAVTAAAKLTERQRRAIAWVFYLRYTRDTASGNPDAYYKRLAEVVTAIGVDVPTGQADYQHIEYVGAGSVGITRNSFGKQILSGVEGLYTRGFGESDFDAGLIDELRKAALIVPAIRTPDRLQVRLLAEQDLGSVVAGPELAPRQEEVRQMLLFDQMTEAEVSDETVDRIPATASIRAAWDDERQSAISFVTLTSVGLALGHAYWSRLTGSQAALSIWLP